MDGGKDIFQPGLLGIKADGEKVLPGVIGYCHDTPEGGDGGATGVRAAASRQPTLLHPARHPEIYAVPIQGESSVCLATRPAACTPPGGLLSRDNHFNFTLFFPQRPSLPRGSPWGPPAPTRPGTGQSLPNGRK